MEKFTLRIIDVLGCRLSLRHAFKLFIKSGKNQQNRTGGINPLEISESFKNIREEAPAQVLTKEDHKEGSIIANMIEIIKMIMGGVVGDRRSLLRIVRILRDHEKASQNIMWKELRKIEEAKNYLNKLFSITIEATIIEKQLCNKYETIKELKVTQLLEDL